MKLSELEVARQLAEQGDYDRAYILCDRHLKENPEDPSWLTILTYLMMETEKPTIAYPLAKMVSTIAPRDPAAWLNFGQAARDLRRDEEAVRFGKRGLKLATDPQQRANLCVNIGSSYIDMGEWDEGEKYCKMALELNPDSIKGKSNLGFCQLAKRQWKEGWKNYRYVLGHEWRPRYQYNDEPEWDGKGKGNIVIYGEQGLGDQISFASMIPDLKVWADKNDSRVILDVSNRLQSLLQRSLPGVKVYGTQGKHNIKWDKEDRKVDYSLPIGQLGEYFRNADDQFPGTPYLTPDPDRVLQWKALFQSKKKPVIGIAWSGGIPKTGSKWRRIGLEALLPVLKSVDAHWVSLQYKDASKEIETLLEKYPEIDIRQYPHATLSGDYDDTVAMMAALNHVVAMHTTAIHVAGGLGVHCWTFVPRNSQWRYGQGEDFPWANSIRLIRQTKRGEWDDVINSTAKELNALFPRVSKTAAKTPRKGKLRSYRAKIRKPGKRHNRSIGDQPSA